MADNCSTCSSLKPSEVFPSKILIFTQNTTRNAISWNPQLKTNPNEVLHAVHLSLHRALDPCAGGKTDECSRLLQESTVASKDGGSSKQVTLVVPRPQDLKFDHLDSSTPQDISVKIRFYGPSGAHRVDEFNEALERLKEATGLTDFDRFVVGLDSLRWSGGTCEESSLGEVRSLLNDGLWQAISSNNHLKKLGVSDFCIAQLKDLLEKIDASKEPLRRPNINQLSFAENEDIDLPEQLFEYARQEGIIIQGHSDHQVPAKGIESLINEFQDRLPVPPSFNMKKDSGQNTIELNWVLKYTNVLKDRGLLADKGFIVSARFLD